MKLIKYFTLSLLFFSISASFSCQRHRVDQSKITMRPKVYMEGASPIPLFDEYDIKGVQIGTVQNIFSEDVNSRVYAVWLTLDRRSSFFLQKETSSNIGRSLQLVSNSQTLGLHPIESTISNGVLPFILSPKLSEQGARVLYEQLSQSIVHIQAELQNQKP